MCKVLIRTWDNGDLPGSYRRGDPVEAREDDALEGTFENEANGFVWLHIPGVSVEQASTYIQEEYSTVHVDEEVVLKRRDRTLDFSKITFTDGRATIQPQKLKNTLVRKN